ncbi:MAG: Type restriction enzyme Eco57I, partial [Planctomycetaceae bacterium]|nr:Type restriction enzyme Eco57I [Planctomycetaceae bacterium]
GSFDYFADSAKSRRGTSEVGREFLNEIEKWRLGLARNLILRNPNLDQQCLNVAVQRIIDRIIFLRIAEDRGIEVDGRLQNLLTGGEVYQRLTSRFRSAHDCYNSGLFCFSRDQDDHETPDELTLTLNIDDEILQGIIRNLYYPVSPYEFSVLPADILGQVYEQFLGKVIRLTATHDASVEEKPDIKQAGGVYYTPTFIVDSIVKQTVGRALHGLTPRQAAKFKLLDPACGSGSFLIGAFQYLLNWHRDWFVANSPEKWPKEIRKVRDVWQLTTASRQDILLNNIFGVDIDPQAVEVTKLSLLLKALEGEHRETIEHQKTLFHERALPDLGNNIKCGNSLIGPEIHEGQSLSNIDDDERLRLNAFDWHSEFPLILSSGGFDAVIGNPPYRREKDFKHLMDEIAATRFGTQFRVARMDLWYYFVHRSLELLRPEGVLGFITNAYWTAGTGSEKLISALRETAHLSDVFLLGKLKVFHGVIGQHLIFRVVNRPSKSPTKIKRVPEQTEHTAEQFVTGKVPLQEFEKSAGELFRDGGIDLLPAAGDLLAKLECHDAVESFAMVRQGIAENPASVNKKTSQTFRGDWTVGEGVFALRVEELNRLGLSSTEQALIRPYHDLKDISRYNLASSPSLRLIYSTSRTCPDIGAYPQIQKHLERFRQIMLERRETRNGQNQWWHLHWPRDEAIWKSDKILAVQMAARPTFAVSHGPTYVPFSVNVICPASACREDIHYLCGVLNSRLLWKWFQHYSKSRGAGLEINGHVLRRAPVRRINFNLESDRTQHERVVRLVKEIQLLHKPIPHFRTDQEQACVEEQIAAVDRQIDQVIYQLYRLTDDEIAVVDAATLS